MYEKGFINIRIIFKNIFENTMTNEWGKKIHLILILKEILYLLKDLYILGKCCVCRVRLCL